MDFSRLRLANINRQKEWDPKDQLSLTFRGCELGGEAGEALNVIKKLERERLGIQGSRSTVERLADELGDVIVCADLIAAAEGIDLWKAVMRVFNRKSAEQGFKTFIE